jgi:hypothetical protein
MTMTHDGALATAPHLVMTPWKRMAALSAPPLATVLGAAMAGQWAVGGRDDLSEGPPGAATVLPWMVEHLPIMDGDDPVWAWGGLFFLSLVLVLPFVWEVTGRVGSRGASWCTRGGLVVATGCIALEYSTPGYGWMFDLAALLVALGGTLACGVSGLRRRTLPPRVAWPLIAALPLTPLSGFLTFWYLPPGLAMGLLIACALAAAGASNGSQKPSMA